MFGCVKVWVVELMCGVVVCGVVGVVRGII